MDENTSNQTQGEFGPTAQIAPKDQIPASELEPSQKPALSKRLHLKFFSVILVIFLIIFAVFYYKTHPLPEFINSSASSLQDSLKNEQIFQSATTIEGKEFNINSNTRVIVESVVRSETTYTETTQVPVE